MLPVGINTSKILYLPHTQHPVSHLRKMGVADSLHAAPSRMYALQFPAQTHPRHFAEGVDLHPALTRSRRFCQQENLCGSAAESGIHPYGKGPVVYSAGRKPDCMGAKQHGRHYGRQGTQLHGIASTSHVSERHHPQAAFEKRQISQQNHIES